MGILVFKSDLIIRSTPINLLLSFGLLIWTQPEKNNWFYGFLILTGIVGFGVEVIGVNTVIFLEITVTALCWDLNGFRYR